MMHLGQSRAPWSALGGLARSAQNRSRTTINKPLPQARQVPASTAPDASRVSSLRVRLSHWTRILGLVAGSYAMIHVFAAFFYEIGDAYGVSMIPTIASHNEKLVLSKWYRRGRGIQVGDIVSFKHPFQEDSLGVKRVLGMPGDFVLRDTPEKGNGVMIQIPEGHCWVVGDNLTFSRDSRIFGPLPLALIKAKVIGRLVPWLETFRNPLLLSAEPTD